MVKIKKPVPELMINKKNNIKKENFKQKNLKKNKNHEVADNGAGQRQPDMIKKSKQNVNSIKKNAAAPPKETKLKTILAPTPKGTKSKTVLVPTPKETKSKTVLAPTPKVKKSKTVLAPTPEIKKPKTVLAPTPEVKKLKTTVEVKKSQTVVAPTPKLKKPKTVLAPTPEVKKPKSVQAPTPEVNNTKGKRALLSTSEPKKLRKISGAELNAKKRKLKTDQELSLESKKSKTILPSKERIVKPTKKTKQNSQTNKSEKPDKKLEIKENESYIKKKNSKEILVPLLEDAPVYDEDKFKAILSSDNVNKVIVALKKMVLNEVKQMKNSIFSDYRYVLNICCFKIASCPKRVVKLKLKNCLAADKDDIVLIVRDLKRGKKVDYEQTIHHFEDLLREQGIKNIKAIIPFNQLKKEYSSYEMKIKFSNLYEYYLCDSAIVGNVVGFLGNSCSKKMRSTIYAIRMNKPNNLKSEIKKSLDKTSYRQGQKGTMISIPIGHHQMKSEEITDNILYVLEQLKTVYPGGPANIRSIHVRINIKSTSSLPIYMSFGHPPEKTPFVIGQREKKLLKLKNDANEILSKFELSTNGEFKKLNKEQILAKRKLKEENTDLIEIELNEKECNELKEKPTKGIKEKEIKHAKKIENGKKDKSSKELKVDNHLKAKSQHKNKDNFVSDKDKLKEGSDESQDDDEDDDDDDDDDDGVDNGSNNEETSDDEDDDEDEEVDDNQEDDSE